MSYFKQLFFVRLGYSHCACSSLIRIFVAKDMLSQLRSIFDLIVSFQVTQVGAVVTCSCPVDFSFSVSVPPFLCCIWIYSFSLTVSVPVSISGAYEFTPLIFVS